MKRVLAFLVLVVPAIALAKEAKVERAGTEPAAYAEMKQLFGAVPDFMKLVPPEYVDSTWADFKGLWLHETAIPAKYKDLISVAVASQIPCRYCTVADTKFARFDGATDRELTEGVLMASLTRRWSTILNGSMQDEAEFRREIDAVFAYVKKNAGKPAPAIEVKDAASAKKDIQQMLGSVPTFLKRYPESALAGAWLQLKQIQFAPGTAIPGKYKELIGVAVASQIPCRYCLYAHREAAKMNGATEAEIDEAIAVAASTRHWSAFLYGLDVDEKAFQKSIDQMLGYVQKQMKKSGK